MTDGLLREFIQEGSADRCTSAAHRCNGLFCDCTCHGPGQARVKALIAAESGVRAVDDTPGPTLLRIVSGAHPDAVSGPGWLEHVALRGDCVCTDAAYFRAEESGAVVAGWLNRHANCRRKDDHD